MSEEERGRVQLRGIAGAGLGWDSDVFRESRVEGQGRKWKESGRRWVREVSRAGKSGRPVRAAGAGVYLRAMGVSEGITATLACGSFLGAAG